MIMSTPNYSKPHFYKATEEVGDDRKDILAFVYSERCWLIERIAMHVAFVTVTKLYIDLWF